MTVASALMLGCADESKNSQSAQQLPASHAREWFDLLITLVRDNALAPPPASRIYAYAGVTYYESVVGGMPQHNSLGGQLNGLGALPALEAGQSYDWPVVASAAMSEVLSSLLATAKPESREAIAALAARQQEERKRDLSVEAFERSMGHGHALAGALLSWAAGDGFAANNNCAYAAPQGVGLWRPTPPAFRPALQPCWGKMRPFALERASFCDAPAPLPYSAETGSAFRQQLEEVYSLVNRKDPEQLAIAQFWSDDPGATGTPPGHWISIVGQLGQQKGHSLGTAAQAYAQVGIAVADAFITCWYTKFEYNYPRPITAVRDLINATWTTPLVTPPFPEFTSGHSVQSGAAAEVLSAQFGDLAFHDDTHQARGLPARDFANFREAAMEAALSRIYGGIHYREACIVGVTQGECVGEQVLSRIRWTGR